METRLAKRQIRSPWATYSVALAAAGAALLLRLALGHWFQDKLPYITFFLGTAASASFGGLGPGLVTTAAGALLAAWYVVPPAGSLLLNEAEDYIGLALFVGVSGFISYTCGRLLDAKRREQALRQLFQQTLLSIGDAVICADNEKQVRFMNRVAEELTGWSAGEAVGRPIEEVFRIVQEGSDTPAEIPLDEVFAKNTIVGLANHTDLITREGRRIPIDDSASPIRTARGEVVGAVLVFRDITRRKLEESELRRLNEDLTQFTFAATHDLREPLRIITVYAQMLDRKYSGALDGDGRRFINQIVDGAGRIGRLVDGLLQFSRINGGDAPAPQPVRTAAAVNGALEALKLVIEDTKAEISCGELPAVLADETHIAQVFQNLIANALKYCPRGLRPQIRIAGVRDGAFCRFTVQDNGIGVAPEFHQQIFQPFKRLHGPEITGAGIGLATCKRIVERYGGRIWVDSEGKGKGACFRFTLPVAEKAERTQAGAGRT